MAEQWAHLARKLVNNAAHEKQRIELRAKESLMYGYAIICLPRTTLDAKVASKLCKLIVQFYNCLVFGIGRTMDTEVRAMHLKVNQQLVV